MARKREFDATHVLDEAADQFVRYGYAGTSVDMLVKATGLKRGSMYQAYKSKSGLFNAAFEYVFSNERLEMRIDMLIVALWERTATDVHLRERVARLVEQIEKEYQRPLGEIIYERILQKSKIKGEM